MPQVKPSATANQPLWNHDHTGNPALAGSDGPTKAAWTTTKGRAEIRVAGRVCLGPYPQSPIGGCGGFLGARIDPVEDRDGPQVVGHLAPLYGHRHFNLGGQTYLAHVGKLVGCRRALLTTVRISLAFMGLGRAAQRLQDASTNLPT